jgi:hypothetical protein
MTEHVQFVLIREWLHLDREWTRADQERKAAKVALMSAANSLVDLDNRRVQVEAALGEISPDWRNDPDFKKAVEMRRNAVMADARA